MTFCFFADFTFAMVVSATARPCPRVVVMWWQVVASSAILVASSHHYSSRRFVVEAL